MARPKAAEFATLEWMNWFNNRRLLGLIGDILPAKVEACCYVERETLAMAA